MTIATLLVWMMFPTTYSGLTVYYTSLARLIEDLKRALEQNRLERRWRVYLRPAVLVFDEVGYMKLNYGIADKAGAQPLMGITV